MELELKSYTFRLNPNGALMLGFEQRRTDQSSHHW